MKKILVLNTGGTISCKQGDYGLQPSLKAVELLDFLDMDTEGVFAEDIFSIDSSNMQPEEWIELAKYIDENVKEYDGIVVCHGTDTMAYTASALTFMLRGIKIPIVLTGAQYPIIVPDSDAMENLKNSLLCIKELSGGVYICFNGVIILGCRSIKTRALNPNAFESIDYPYIGTVYKSEFFKITDYKAESEYLPQFDLETKVAVVKLFPGVDTCMINSLMKWNCRGVVVESFGVGGVPGIRRNITKSLHELLENQIPVVLVSQCFYDGVKPGVYQVSHDLSISEIAVGNDMTTEAAVTKLMWALRRTSDMKEIKKLMETSLCGEIRIK